MSRSSRDSTCGRALRVVAIISATALLAGCFRTAEEPGLFERSAPPGRSSPPGTDKPSPAPVTNPSLPVLAEDVWTSADGLEVQVRIAVHAIRRISGATVLDWSVTPLKAPSLRIGDAVPASLELGLSRPNDERPRIDLVASDAGHVYRPLSAAAGSRRCVCTPLPVAQQGFRVGHTTLLQIAFPALPTSSSAIDVAFATVPPFWRVPVTAAGQVPVAVASSGLGRPAESDRRGETTPIDRAFSNMFRYGPGEQIFRFQVNRVVASDTFTALEWTIWSVTGGEGVDSATSPPFTGSDPDGFEVTDPVTASGPDLLLAAGRAERSLRPRYARSDPADPSRLECLCTTLQGWAAMLRRPDHPATVVTSYPPLPPGTRRAQIRFAGLGVISVPVTAAPDARARLAGTRPWGRTTWRAGDLRSADVWGPDQWPTPVPAADQLPAGAAGPDVLLR